MSPGNARSGGLPLVLLTVGVLCVSVSGIIAHRALVEASPLMLAAWRMGASALFFVALPRLPHSRTAESAAPINASERARLVLAGVVLAVHFIVWFASLTLTTVSVATLLVCTTPLWTAVGQIVTRRTRAGGEFWVSFLVALLGIALIVRPAAGASGVTSAQVWGDLLGLSGGMVFAVYLLAIDGLQHISSARIVAWTYTVAASVLWIAALVAGHPTLSYSAPVWEAILLLTVVSQMIGHTLLNDALRTFEAHVVAFSILAEPVIAAALAVALLREVVTPIMLAGGVLVLASLAVVLARSRRKRTAIEAEEL